MYLKRIPHIIKRLYPEAIFDFPSGNNMIYLTFDDGPQKSSTSSILNMLDKFDSKATFFCTGKNVKENESSFNKIIDRGHKIGNHSYSHPNGWFTKTKIYLDDIEEASKYIKSDFFRPPFGKLSLRQYNSLKAHYKIIFWSSMPGDFMEDMSAELLMKNLKKSSIGGAVIALHDHEKNIARAEEVLPQYLKWALEKGFKFATL